MLRRNKYDEYWKDLAEKEENKIHIVKRSLKSGKKGNENIKSVRKGLLQRKAG